MRQFRGRPSLIDRPSGVETRTSSDLSWITQHLLLFSLLDLPDFFQAVNLAAFFLIPLQLLCGRLHLSLPYNTTFFEL